MSVCIPGTFLHVIKNLLISMRTKIVNFKPQGLIFMRKTLNPIIFKMRFAYIKGTYLSRHCIYMIT